MSEIIIFAASDLEYRTLRAALTGWQNFTGRLPAGTGQCGQTSVDLFTTAMGPRNAQRAAREALARSPARYVLMCGFAGALARQCRIGDVVIYRHCFNEAGARLDCDLDFVAQLHARLSNKGLAVHCGGGITLPRVLCRAGEKSAAAAAHDAIAVDMESHEIIAAAREAGRVVTVARIISDDAISDLPDLNTAMNDEAEVNNFKMMLTFARHPQLAIRFLRNLTRANRALAQLLPAAINDSIGDLPPLAPMS